MSLLKTLMGPEMSKLKLFALAGVVILLLGLLLSLSFCLLKIKDQTASIKSLKETVQTQKAELDVKDEVIKSQAVLREKERDRNEFETQSKINTQKSRGTVNDGPIAPVLRDELIRLRDRQKSNKF